jgi:hypothetical protein
MRTYIISHFLHFVLSPSSRLAAAVNDRIARLIARIDANDLPYQHRMGAWESFASFRAQAIREAAEKRAAGE